jgi:probable phosphoglycerate mutase
MTTTIILIRHGAHDLLGRVLAGRMAEVGLNAEGLAQARLLGRRLSSTPVEAVYSSPLRRARETAQWLGTAVQIDDAFDEIDTGAWTGVDFDTLQDDREWRRWNEHRSLARCPGGESFIEVQARVARGLERLTARHPEQTIAVVTHSDIIKAAIAYCLGLPLDFHARFSIEPASLSVLVLGEWGAKLLKLNQEQTP